MFDFSWGIFWAVLAAILLRDLIKFLLWLVTA
jgi:hypothetical protein